MGKFHPASLLFRGDIRKQHSAISQSEFGNRLIELVGQKPLLTIPFAEDENCMIECVAFKIGIATRSAYMSSSLFNLVRGRNISRYVSMRIHGASAQIQSDTPEDTQRFTIQRVPKGTQISADFPAAMTVHLSIPTPLLVEHTEPLLVLANQPTAQVFKGTAVDVVRIELYLNASRGVKLGTFTAMDGDRPIAQAKMDDMFEAIAPEDEFLEEGSMGMGLGYALELSKRVYHALGLSFGVIFTHDLREGNGILLIGAKAIFRY